MPGPTRSRAIASDDARDQLFVDRTLDQHPATGRAGLPGVLHDGIDDDGHRRVQVRVGEDDLRRLAAEFQRHRAVVSRGSLRHRRCLSPAIR